MAGQGKRFRRAGYDTYKPFLPIFGKPMIQYVLDAFPAHVTKHILVDRALITDEQLAYLRAQSGVVVHFVASHSLGPAYTIHEARNHLPLDESFFIAYADIFWTWDYAQVERLLDADGVVFTRREFHPHLVGNNFSAFCKPTPGDDRRLAEIKEKGSFTDDWMNEPLSVGAFYVRDGHAMIRAINTMIGEDRKVAQEFFPSLLFNDIVKAGGNVRLSDVDFFVHWGVPTQLEDLRAWVNACRTLTQKAPASNAVNVCCMGGSGVRMQSVSAVPKALMPVSGVPMFRYVADRFGCKNELFIVNDGMAETLASKGVRDASIVNIGAPTKSQLDTLKAASTTLRKQKQFFLTSCDATGLWDNGALNAFLQREKPDAIVFTFVPTLLQANLGGSHTYVSVDGQRVTGVHIKHKPNDDARGLAGFFWFNDGSAFAELDRIPDDAGRELSADHVLKHMVDTGRKVGAFPVDTYLHLGSPLELKEFEFWNKYHMVFAGA